MKNDRTQTAKLQLINMQNAAQTSVEIKQTTDAKLAQFSWIVNELATRFSTRFASASIDDLKQVGLIALKKMIDGPEPNRASFGTYAYAGVRTSMLLFLRDAPDSSRDVSIDTSDDDDETIQIADSRPNPEQQMMLDEQNKIVAQAIAKLPEEDRGLIQMHFWDGFTIREIAEHLDSPKSTISDALQRALQKLRPLVEELR